MERHLFLEGVVIAVTAGIIQVSSGIASMRSTAQPK